MSRFFGGVWRHPQFRMLWAGQATSMFGSLIGGLALDLVAIITLHAAPAQIALLNGCGLVPGMVAGPWAGVWADRLHHRSLLIAADVGRALMLASVPIAALSHHLTMPQLYVVAAVMSALTMLFDVSIRAYVPSIVRRDQLVQANSVLSGTDAATEAGGFAAAGLLIQMVTAPVAVGFDALSFVASVVSLAAIHGDRPEEDISKHHKRPGSIDDIRQGAAVVWRDSVLRAVTVAAFLSEMRGMVVGVVIMLFFVRNLHLQPATMGPVFGVGGVSAFVGALVASRVTRRWGVGRSMIWSMYVDGAGMIATVLAGGPLWLVIVLLVLAQCSDGGRTIYEINVVSLLQSRVPPGKVGRVFATFETVRSGAMLLGLGIGGSLGQVLSLRAVLVVAGAASLLVPLCLVFSPVRNLRNTDPNVSRRELLAM